MSNSRYQAYFAVEGGWFNELPAHWQKLPSNRVFEQRRESAKEDDEQLSATQKYGVVPQSLFMALDDRKVTLALAGTDNFKHVDEGNFVISLRSFEGGIELSNYSGCVSPAYTCLKARKPIANDYYKFALKCSDYILALQSVTQGIRDGKNISYGEFSRLSVPYPPLLEQLAIATFLDRETAKIDALIAEQQRLIELLQEKRQAVISHAVTKGLNPDAPMKDSGVEWLGEVPEHWAVGKLSYYSVIGTGATPDRQRSDYWNGDIPWIKTGEVRYEDIHQAEESISELALNETSCSLLNPGTLLMALYGQGVTRGRVGMLAIQASCNQACATIAPTDSLNGRYLELYLTNAYEHIRSLGNETTQQNLNLDFVRELELLLPPTEEQQLIWQACKERAVGMDSLLGCSLDAIALLQERRSALISAAVTGQIDVRGLVPEASTA